MGGKVDLSDAYHHLRLHPDIQDFFLFTIMGEFFQCIALPFGWCLAPYAYTKFMRPVIAALRQPTQDTRSNPTTPLATLLPITQDYYT